MGRCSIEQLSYQRCYYRKNRRKILADKKQWAADHYDSIRNNALQCKYGLTLEQFNKFVVKQNGKCMLCGFKKKLCVDHCHKTGVVRGLLCKGCNTRLSWFDNEKQFKKVMQYLKKGDIR